MNVTNFPCERKVLSLPHDLSRNMIHAALVLGSGKQTHLDI